MAKFENAQTDSSAEYKKGFDKGFNDGFDEGRKTGFDRGYQQALKERAKEYGIQINAPFNVPENNKANIRGVLANLFYPNVFHVSGKGWDVRFITPEQKLIIKRFPVDAQTAACRDTLLFASFLDAVDYLLRSNLTTADIINIARDATTRYFAQTDTGIAPTTQQLICHVYREIVNLHCDFRKGTTIQYYGKSPAARFTNDLARNQETKLILNRPWSTAFNINHQLSWFLFYAGLSYGRPVRDLLYFSEKDILGSAATGGVLDPLREQLSQFGLALWGEEPAFNDTSTNQRPIRPLNIRFED